MYPARGGSKFPPKIGANETTTTTTKKDTNCKMIIFQAVVKCGGYIT
jgi:hypothetical protein